MGDIDPYRDFIEERDADREPPPTPEDDRFFYEAAERQAIEAFVAVARLNEQGDRLTEGTLGEMANVYAKLQPAYETLGFIRDILATAIGEAMGDEFVVLDGLGGFKRSPKRSVEWDNDGVREKVLGAVRGMCADPETGEIPDSVTDALDALQLVYTLSSPKVGGLREFNLNPDEYRATHKTGYRVKHTPVKAADTDGPF